MALYADPHLPPVTVLPAVGTSFSHGEVVAPSASTATQLPSISAVLVHIVAKSTNSGNIYLGSSSSVTPVTGSTNVTAGLEHPPGHTIGWLRLKANLNELWFTADNSGDGVTYFVSG